MAEAVSLSECIIPKGVIGEILSPEKAFAATEILWDG